MLENGDIVRHFERAEKPEEINEIVAANQLDSTAVSSCLLINCASVISPLLVGSNSEQQKKRIAAAGSGLKRREEEFSDTNQISYQKNSGCLLETML